MNDIDRKIREALRGEDADILDEIGDLSVREEAFEVFRTRQKWLTIWATFFGIVFMIVGVVCVIRFFEAEAVRDWIMYAGIFMFSMSAVGAMKIWFWMEMQKNAITREVKRVELLLARLAPGLSKS